MGFGDHAEFLQTHAYVEEADELQELVRQVVESRGSNAAVVYPRFSQLLTKYQEQAQLLDPLMDGLVKPLAHLLMALAAPVLGTAPPDASACYQVSGTPAPQPPAVLLGVARLLWQLSTVRGYKAVLHFFPNDVSHFEPTLALACALEAATGDGRIARSGSFDDGHGLWEAQHVCLLWLALLVLIPFDLALVDTSLTAPAGGASEVGAAGAASVGAGYPPIVGTLLALCRRHLASPGSTREMAAVVLGRLITRPDMGAALAESVEWACGALQAPPDDPQTAFLVPGVSLALATALKLGKRSTLLAPAVRLLPLATQLQESRLAGSNALARKLAVKLVQRIGLVFLRPRIASWRYQKPRLNMALNLARAAAVAAAGPTTAAGTGSTAAEPPPAAAPAARAAPDAVAADAAAAAQAEAAAEAEASEDVAAAADQLECVIEALLVALADKDTVVRWSAAKGLGRVTMRLPRELADEVVGSVLDGFFTPSASDTAWHGGCLAVAELASRGLLLPARLPAVAPLVLHALEYDVRRGPCSVGAHVRDAAAYVCWALARAYSPAALGPAAGALAPALITCGVYDREVNCRRAAAAAFQECVGRLGTFPHGIAVLTAADYFSVAARSNAYLSVAPAVAKHDEYFEPLAWHLLRVKLRHWEKALRELAAQALAALVPHRPAFFMDTALPFLVPLCVSDMLEARHGAVAGVAELLPALRLAGVQLAEAAQADVAGIVPALEAGRLTRGKGGEVMRSAICRLIQTSAHVGLPLGAEQQAACWRQLCDNLRHPAPEAQLAAAEALRAFASHYLPHWTPVEQQRQVLDRFLADLAEFRSPPARRGAALALGVLPAWLLAPSAAARVLPMLAAATSVEEAAEQRDAEARVQAVRALTQTTLALHTWHQHGGHTQANAVAENEGSGSTNGSHPAATIGSWNAASAVQVLLAALDDYSIDNRGDVGSWVREAAMEGIVTLLLNAVLPEAFPSSVAAPGAAAGTHEQQQQQQEEQQVQEQKEQQAMQGQARMLVQSVAAALLQQAVERIARLREAAAAQLAHLIRAAVAVGAGPAAAAALQAAVLGHGAEAFATLEAMPAAAALLTHPEYQRPLLEGLAFSIGGLDRQLSDAATEALAQAGARLDEAGCAGLAATLLDVCAARARDARLCMPLLTATEVLLARTGVGEVAQLPADAAAAREAAGSDNDVAAQFPSQLLAWVQNVMRGSSDIPRLHAGVSVLCQLAGVPGRVGREALRAALLLLGNRYPKVRRYTAEQVYTSLLTQDAEQEGVGSDGPGHDDHASQAVDPEAAMELLLETAWDGPLEAAKQARARVFELLRLPPPVPPAGASAGDRKAAEAAGTRDDAESYAALIERAARGL